jgi:SAM-dependent methyltransferase
MHRGVTYRSILAVRAFVRSHQGESVTETPWPERIDPATTVPGVVAYHLAKYRFARERVHGLVIDVACGVGYGTSFLAETVEALIGVELANEAIQIARSLYATDNCRFLQGNAECLPFDDDVADAITCFEGIEHFKEPGAHLDEVARVLREDGSYLVSTPHPHAHTHGEDNPFHLHEFEPAQFEAMLRARFQDVTMFGQFRVQTDAHRTAQKLDVLGIRKIAWLRPLAKTVSRAALKTVPVEEATLDDFEIRPFEGEATEYVAVCTGPSGALTR